ncbi:hypothetical protein ACO1O0_006196 [Amphichorda felina]
MHNQSAENDNPHSAGRVNSEYAPPSNPHVSSIRPSDITKRQLEILRVRLKYLEDQLSYNKHQIDERTVENDAQITRQHIGQFEKNLEIQLSIEESQYPKSDQQSDLGEAAPSNDGMILKPSASGEVKANSSSNDSSNGGQPRSRSRAQNTGKDKTSSRLNVGINSTKSASAFAGWKAPRNSPAVSDQLNKGLPKFNGKDFFPPSPDKHRSSDETSSAAFSVGEMPLVGAGTECGASAMNSGIDPFQGLGQSGQILTRDGPGHSTQSESLPRRGQDSTENLTATTSRTAPYGMRVGRSLDDQNRDSQETAPTSSASLKDKSSSDEAEDDRELIFTGRRTMAKPVKVRNEIWSTMLKKGPTSANAVPGAISSTTAQGVLPHYAGHATASLAPTIANQAVSPRSLVSKSSDQGERKVSGPAAEKSDENSPPCETAIDETL